MNARARRARQLLRTRARINRGMARRRRLARLLGGHPWEPFVALPGEIGLTTLHDKILDVLHTITLEDQDPEEAPAIIGPITGYEAYLLHRLFPESH